MALDDQSEDTRRYKLSGVSWPVNGGQGVQLTWSRAARNYNNQGDLGFIARPSDRMVAILRRAFDAWSAVANVRFREVADGSYVNIRIGVARIDGFGRVFAQARSQHRATAITRAFIAFDASDLRSSTTEDAVYAAAVHEIGHALGLGHSRWQTAIMYPTNNLNGDEVSQIFLPLRTELTSDDIAGIRRLYGAPVGAAERSVARSGPSGINDRSSTMAAALSAMVVEKGLAAVPGLERRHPLGDVPAILAQGMTA